MLDTGTLEALTPYQQQLHDAHKARHAKWQAAAKQQAKPPAPDKSKFSGVEKCQIVQRFIASEMGVDVGDINGLSRFPHFVEPRFIAMFLTRELAELSDCHIGRLFGGRDHATIIYADRRIRQRMRREVGFSARISSLKARLLRQFAEG